MAWQVHHGGQTRDEVSPDAALTMSLFGDQLSMCEDCKRTSVAFLAQCLAATKQAGKMPDDQLWLAVFNALKEMLGARDGCYACHSLRTPGKSSPDPMVSRLSVWNRTKKAISGK